MAEENMCLDSMGPSRKPNRSVEIQKCHRAGGNQIFMITERGEIQEKKFCMDATKPGAPVKLLSCHGEGGNQIWFYDSEVCVLNCFHLNLLIEAFIFIKKN